MSIKYIRIVQKTQKYYGSKLSFVCQSPEKVHEGDEHMAWSKQRLALPRQSRRFRSYGGRNSVPAVSHAEHGC